MLSQPLTPTVLGVTNSSACSYLQNQARVSLGGHAEADVPLLPSSRPRNTKHHDMVSTGCLLSKHSIPASQVRHHSGETLVSNLNATWSGTIASFLVNLELKASADHRYKRSLGVQQH